MKVVVGIGECWLVLVKVLVGIGESVGGYW